ncbi:hypothetical protein PFFCH_05508, partial [Plasmodium falciparum FCH/4]
MWGNWNSGYKEEKKPQGGVGSPQLPQPGSGSDDSDHPQNQLASGTIPPAFLRQMFYTLGDYRDIVVRGVADDKNGGNNIVVDTSDDKDAMQKIQKKIKDIVEKPNGGTPPGKTSDNPRVKWWKTNGQHIWNGMICALTYTENTSGPKGQTSITQDPSLKGALLDDSGKKPKTKNNNGPDYTYENVELKDNDENGGPRSGSSTTSQTTQSLPSGEKKPPKLSDFVLRPPYFRYLEEWGESFCRERRKRLEKIKGECTEDGDTQKYSGDGEACDKIHNEDGTVPDLEGPSCATPCGLYKRWIGRKKIEFTKQSGAYDGQKTKYEEERTGAEGNSGIYDQNFVGKLRKDYKSIGLFLNSLKSGPCSKKDNDNAEDNIDFGDEGKTFKPATNCAPCSKFKVNCKNVNCHKTKGNNCNGITDITKDNIETMGNFTQEVTMLVSDDSKSGSGFKGNGLEPCRSADIFKGFREDVWKCVNICGLDVCGLKNGNGSIDKDQKQIIIIRALLRRWVEYFLEDYNRIKHKISHCIKNGENKCINGCNKKCTCVEQWIQKKRTEWETIRDRFNEQYKNETPDDYNVRSFLETWIPQIPVANANNDGKKLIKLSQFDNSCGCCASASSTNGKNEDAIDCMLDKLGEKAKTCEQKHDENGDKKCNETLPETIDETFDNDIEIEEAKKNMMPTICNDVIKPEEETDDKCGKQDEEEKDDKKEKGDGGENRGSEGPKPAEPPSSSTEDSGGPKTNEDTPVIKPEEDPLPPAPADEPFDSTILQTTIPFGVALALGSIAFLFLKVKENIYIC